MLTIKSPVVTAHNTVEIPFGPLTTVFAPLAGQIDHIEFITSGLVGTVIDQNSISISGPLIKKVFYVPVVVPPATQPLTVAETITTLNVPIVVTNLGLLDPALDTVQIEVARVVSVAADFFLITTPVPGVTVPATAPPFGSMVETDIIKVEYKVLEPQQLLMERESGNIIRIPTPGVGTVLPTTP